ncbi:hypothetical protein F511_31101 [Dorcoceras hygrometricum]|uniref:Uncharacterized protein n=1 Tax=Dorcoceras hygrometricum TaxID=472368 RepID=A0A2Z7C7T5_9LAMI|nr:hypothetical protein F511_31101 [Dorcoceras hygrometricum]
MTKSSMTASWNVIFHPCTTLVVVNSSPDGTVTARATPKPSGIILILYVNALKINEWVVPESSKERVVTPSTRISPETETSHRYAFTVKLDPKSSLEA